MSEKGKAPETEKGKAPEAEKPEAAKEKTTQQKLDEFEARLAALKQESEEWTKAQLQEMVTELQAELQNLKANATVNLENLAEQISNLKSEIKDLLNRPLPEQPQAPQTPPQTPETPQAPETLPNTSLPNNQPSNAGEGAPARMEAPQHPEKKKRII